MDVNVPGSAAPERAWPDSAWHEAAPDWPWPDVPVLDGAMRDRSVMEALSTVVGRHGGVVALEDGLGSLTFGALWAEIGTLAWAMADTAGPVGILLPPGPAYSVALFACLVVGRPSVLLDPAVPMTRTMDLIAQVGVGLVLLAPDAAVPRGVACVAVRLGAMGREGLPSVLGVHEPAVILCTSGSTGRPKAIVHSQRTMMGKAWAQMNGMGVRAGDLCLSLSPPSTMGGAVAMVSCAVAGVGLRFLDLRREGIAGLIETLTQRPVTVVRAAPSALRLITALPEAAQVLRGVRSVGLLSEPVLRTDVAALRACLPQGAVLYTNYGSTESGTIAWYPSAADTQDPVRAPAGRLTPGTAALILDERGAPCPPGEPGELVLRSPYAALGEWHEGSCRPGPFLPDPGDPLRRIHRTGDVALRGADGVYVVLGRADRMLKVNGQRVEPGEIEAALRACEGVVDGAVISPNGRTIVAFVVLRAGVLPGPLRGMLRDRLPAAMVPARIVPIDALPRLAGGKVDLVRLTVMAAGGGAG